jgi:hypothetical protein
MKHGKNMFKVLTAALLLSANLAFAADVNRNEVKENDGIWAEFLDSIRNTKLSQKISLPSIELFRGIEIGGNYEFNSDPSVNQNYSGIDIWEISAGLDSRIFGYELPVNAGFRASKKITYIQQFQDRRDSLLRIPYDPITKIPRTAQDFFRRDKDNKLVFKVGDFIGYRIPLTFGADASAVKNILGSALPVTAGYRYFMSGEFDIQVFRMSENLIRLKIIAVNDKAYGWTGGVKIFSHDPVTSFIVEQVFDDRVYRGHRTERNTDLYIGDYVLNLESTEARALYDSIIAQKMKILNVDLVREYISTTQFLKDREQFNKNLFADLSQFNNVSNADKDLSIEKRRVIKIINAENHTNADDDEDMFKLIRLVKYTRNKNTANAEIAVVGDVADSKEHFFLHSMGKNSKWNFLDNWKKEKRSQLNVLFKADEKGFKTGLVALHFAKSRKHFSLGQKNYLNFFETTAEHMPQEIKAKIKFPHETQQLRKNYDNIYLNFDLYITNKIFELNQNLSTEVINQRLTKLLSKIKSLEGTSYRTDKDQVVTKLPAIFSNSSDLNDKFNALTELTTKNQLFSDYGSVIMMNVMNPESISESVLAQLSYSGHDIEAAVSKYPSEESFNRINLFKNIIEQNNYILDRSYNLRHFLKEDGKPYSLPELILKNGTIGL